MAVERRRYYLYIIGKKISGHLSTGKLYLVTTVIFLHNVLGHFLLTIKKRKEDSRELILLPYWTGIMEDIVNTLVLT